MNWIQIFALIFFLPFFLNAQNSAEEKLFLAKEKLKKNDTTAAMKVFTEIIKADSSAIDALYERGRIFSEQRKYLAAIEDFNRVTRINPKHQKAFYLRGYARFLMNNFRQAIDDLNASIELYPESALAFWYRAEAKNKTGDKTGACEDWQKAYELGYLNAANTIYDNCKEMSLSTEVAADVFIRKGDEQMNEGNFKAALAEYSKAGEISPKSGYILYNIGLAKFLLKDKTGACAAWREARTLKSSESAEMIKQHCQ